MADSNEGTMMYLVKIVEVNFLLVIIRSDWYDIKYKDVWKSEKILFCSNFFLYSNKKWLMWYKKWKKVKNLILKLTFFFKEVKIRKEKRKLITKMIIWCI